MICLCPDCHRKVTFAYPEYSKALDAEIQGKKVSQLPKKYGVNPTQSRILKSQLKKIYTNVKDYFGYEFKKLNLKRFSSLFIKKNISIGSIKLAKTLPSKRSPDRVPKSFKGNYFKGFRVGDLVEFECNRYFTAGVNAKTSIKLMFNLKEWQKFKDIVPRKLKLIHSFGSLPVEEVQI